jgi:hypothetical protein
LSDILAETDVVVRGFVGTGRSYLSDDQMDVLTDLSIERPVVIYERVAKPVRTPGAPASMTVTQNGGTVSVGDLTYTQTHGALPPLERNTECLLLLTTVGGKYHVAGTYYGAFDLRGGKMVPLTGKAGFASEVKDQPVSLGLAVIMEQLRRTKR